jgi:hypothetical protein
LISNELFNEAASSWFLIQSQFVAYAVESKMLEKLQPFKFVFKILQEAGMWRTKNHSKWRNILAKTIFIWLHPVGALFLIFSIPQAENITDFAQSAFFSCVSLNSCAYGITFVLLNQQIEDLIADISRIFSEQPEAGKILVSDCRKIVKGKVLRYSMLLFCVVIGIMGPAFTGTLFTPMYTPISMKGTAGYFYFGWIYGSVDMIYLGVFTTASMDLLFEFLFCIDAYILFFKGHLMTADFGGRDGKKRLIECIDMHQSIKR